MNARLIHSNSDTGLYDVFLSFNSIDFRFINLGVSSFLSIDSKANFSNLQPMIRVFKFEIFNNYLKLD